MGLIRTALRHPVSVLIAVLAIALCAGLALQRIPVDIFPNLNLPVIYVAQPYGGMDPGQMEGYLVNYYEYHFLYIVGIERVESKSIQNVGLLKLTFHPGTDMNQALAQTISYVDRARSFMPAGTVPPFVVRFDAGSVPVGQLIFSSATRGVGEISNLALFRVRPMFATLPGVSAPPPFGGNQRTIVIHVDPDRLRAYQLAPEAVVAAVASGNLVLPAGNVRIGDLNRMAPMNAVVRNIQDLQTLPLHLGAGPTVLLRDVATIEDSTDILSGYALVNGRRTVYIPVTKRSDASTLTVVNEVKAALPGFRALIPPDINITFAFDQSVYVRNALGALTREGFLGAVLTGLMVLLFLRDWRSALIVVLTIPFALLSAVVGLWALGQTLNLMTLGGLALAIGVLVDEATVAVENIHTHLARGTPPARAVLVASAEVVRPRFLAMLAVMAVFIPSFLMTGVGRALFVPLSLAVGLAMLASFFLSSALVPVVAVWGLRAQPTADDAQHAPRWTRFRHRYERTLQTSLRHRAWVLVGYAVALLLVVLTVPHLGREIFPAADSGQFQVRLRAPTGTRVERTEALSLTMLRTIEHDAGPGQVALTLGYVGTQPTTYPVNTINLWTSGSHEAVFKIALQPHSHLDLDAFKEKLRRDLPRVLPDCQFSFEAGDAISQIMNFGAPTPVEVAVRGPNFADVRAYAARLLPQLQRVPSLRDVQIEQPLDYPTVNVDINRERAGQLGVTMAQAGRSLVEATSSSRFTAPNYWRDPASGIGFQVQVEIPQARMASLNDVANIPVSSHAGPGPLLGDIAQISYGTAVGEYDRFNGQRVVTVAASLAGHDLGQAARAVAAAVQRAGTPPRGVTVNLGGQIGALQQTFAGLQIGLLLAILVIFLLLAANCESLRLALVVIATVPAVLAGVALMLLFTHTTLNVQSFMGTIMAVGVAVANAILLVTVAEQHRCAGAAAADAALAGASSRLRPILMTSVAMMAGMLPLALALGSGAEQSAPLGRAVLGGLLAATLSTLLVVPVVFALLQGHAGLQSPSLDPDDAQSPHWEARGPQEAL